MKRRKYPLDIIILIALVVLTVLAFLVLSNEKEVEPINAEENRVLGTFKNHKNKILEGILKIEIEQEIYNTEFNETTTINKGNILSKYGVDLYRDEKYETNYITFERAEFIKLEFLPGIKSTYSVKN